MLTCTLCAKMGHIKIDCHLKTQNSWVILVPKGQKIPIYLEAIKNRPRKRKRTQNGVYYISFSTSNTQLTNPEFPFPQFKVLQSVCFFL